MKIPTIDFRSPVRISLDKILIPEIKNLKGSILDIGSGEEAQYRKHVKAYTKYVTLDIDPTTNANIISPIKDMKVRDDSFDNIICTEVLEHCPEPHRAIDEIHRVLVKGGTCILTTRFMYPFHKNPNDYFRYSKEGLEHLFRNFQGVEITSQGNRIMFFWEMINPNFYTRAVLNLFSWFVGLFNFKDEKFAMGYMVVATK
jgi:SAM-dependent methyltransferase